MAKEQKEDLTLLQQKQKRLEEIKRLQQEGVSSQKEANKLKVEEKRLNKDIQKIQMNIMAMEEKSLDFKNKLLESTKEIMGSVSKEGVHRLSSVKLEREMVSLGNLVQRNAKLAMEAEGESLTVLTGMVDVGEKVAEAKLQQLKNQKNIGKEDFQAIDLSKQKAKLEEMEALRLSAGLDGRTKIGKAVLKDIQQLKLQIKADEDRNAVLERQHKLVTMGTETIMGGFDKMKGAIESLPGGKLISETLGLDKIGKKLSDNVSGILAESFDPKTLKAAGGGLKALGASGASAFSAIGSAAWAAMAPLAPYLLAILAIVAAFKLLSMGWEKFKKIDKAAEDFRKTTGFTTDQMKSLDKEVLQVQKDLKAFGVDIEGAYAATKSLSKEFGNINRVSKEAISNVALMEANWGVAADTAAGVTKQWSEMSNKDPVKAQEDMAKWMKIAEDKGVSVNDVMNDMNAVAGDTAAYFQGNPDALAAAAIQARRMGLELSTLTGMADNLLNIESSMEAEMEASMLLGRQINMDKARELALMGDIEGATKEVLKQVGGIEEYNKLLPHQQQALAKAAGMTVDELGSALKAEEEMNLLKEAGLQDEYNALDAKMKSSKMTAEDLLRQKKMQGTMTNINNAWNSIKEVLAETFMPIIQEVMDAFNEIVESMGGMKNFAMILGVVFKAAMAPTLVAWHLIKNVIKSIAKLIGGIIKIFKGDFIGGIKDIGGGIWDFIMAPFNAVKDFVASMLRGIWDILPGWLQWALGKLGMGPDEGVSGDSEGAAYEDGKNLGKAAQEGVEEGAIELKGKSPSIFGKKILKGITSIGSGLKKGLSGPLKKGAKLGGRAIKGSLGLGKKILKGGFGGVKKTLGFAGRMGKGLFGGVKKMAGFGMRGAKGMMGMGMKAMPMMMMANMLGGGKGGGSGTGGGSGYEKPGADIDTDKNPLIEKMDELIATMKEYKPVVHMDGQKVGEILADAAPSKGVA